MVAHDALFAVKESPMRVYKAPDYQASFENGTNMTYSEVLPGADGE